MTEVRERLTRRERCISWDDHLSHARSRFPQEPPLRVDQHIEDEQDLTILMEAVDVLRLVGGSCDRDPHDLASVLRAEQVVVGCRIGDELKNLLGEFFVTFLALADLAIAELPYELVRLDRVGEELLDRMARVHTTCPPTITPVSITWIRKLVLGEVELM